MRRNDGLEKRSNNHFQQISQSFLDNPTLTFAKVLSAEVVEATFRKYDSFREGGFYSTAIVLWAFLSQVLADGKSASASAAVSRITIFFGNYTVDYPGLHFGVAILPRFSILPSRLCYRHSVVGKIVNIGKSYRQKSGWVINRIIPKFRGCCFCPYRANTPVFGVYRLTLKIQGYRD